MLTASDSFIQFLDTNLAGDPAVHWRRHSAVDEQAVILKQDALNVSLLGFYEEDSLEMCLVSLDLLATDERVALRWLKLVRDLLVGGQIITERDHTNPAVPVPTGRKVSWTGRRINFLNIRTPRGSRYVHYNATFPLLYARE